MTDTLPDFKLHRPQTVKEVFTALAQDENARICAGGTDLIVNMRHGLIDTETLIDISSVEEISSINLNKNQLRIGAGVTLAQLARNDSIAETFPVLHQACLAIAGPTHRTRATVGGNLCLDTRCLYYNQSHWWRKSNDFCLKYRGDICHVAPKGNRCRAAFSGDLAPALIALGAEIELTGPQGQRTIALEGFYREDGADHLTLDPQEIITSVFVKIPSGKSAYQKIRVRGAMDFPLAGV
ncbi:MAG TPA: 4-hydroxybenzoyl-CoA reductase subunit beta, partial [Rhizobiales bacterium]|nr:4-hydroxybenzoyl-CoA reductase subunit beta [Hyphomicrobiales bacterium]